MKEFDLAVFSDRLRTLLDSKGASARSVALDAGITPTTLTRYLNAERQPEITNIVKLADYFNVSIDWLLLQTEEMRGIPADMRDLIDRYSLASESDRFIINSILAKYAGTKD